MILSEQQQRVVAHRTGPALVAAVAGAGKTRAVTERVAALVEAKVFPERICCLTFTKAAAEEMISRLTAKGIRCGSRREMGRTYIATFHSLGYTIGKSLFPEWEDVEIDDSGTKYAQVIRAALASTPMFAKQEGVEPFVALFSRAKNEMCHPDWGLDVEGDVTTSGAAKLDRINAFFQEHASAASLPYPARAYARLYLRTEEIVRQIERVDVPSQVARVLGQVARAPFITFDDMLLRSVQALLLNPGLGEDWASCWEYVVVDEAQDNNLARNKLVNILGSHGNVMLVGDPGQAIYGFAGARPDLFTDFAHREGTQLYAMSENYRSVADIISCANAILSTHVPEESRLGVLLDAVLPARPGSVRSVVGEGEMGIADEIGKEVQRALAAGRRPQDIAVLCRFRSGAELIIRRFDQMRIPWKCKYRTTLFRTPEVQALVAYLKLASGSRASLELVGRALHAPERKLKRVLNPEVVLYLNGQQDRVPGKDYERERVNEWLSVLEELKRRIQLQPKAAQSVLDARANVDAAQNAFLSARAHFNAVQGDGGDVVGEAWAWVEGAKEAVKEAEARLEETEEWWYDEISPGGALSWLCEELGYVDFLEAKYGQDSATARRVENVRIFLRIAQEYSDTRVLIADVDEAIARVSKHRYDPAADAVTIATAHSAKGLEWPMVIIHAADNDVWPAPQAMEKEEEARLFYVAVTRAREELVFTLNGRGPIDGDAAVDVLPALPSPYYRTLVRAGLVQEIGK